MTEISWFRVKEKIMGLPLIQKRIVHFVGQSYSDKQCAEMLCITLADVEKNFDQIKETIGIAGEQNWREILEEMSIVTFNLPHVHRPIKLKQFEERNVTFPPHEEVAEKIRTQLRPFERNCLEAMVTLGFDKEHVVAQRFRVRVTRLKKALTDAYKKLGYPAVFNSTSLKEKRNKHIKKAFILIRNEAKRDSLLV